MRGSVNSAAAFLNTSSTVLPLANLSSCASPQSGSSPYLPGNILNVSPTHTVAILQSTKLLNTNFSEGIRIACGVASACSFLEVDVQAAKQIINIATVVLMFIILIGCL